MVVRIVGLDLYPVGPRPTQLRKLSTNEGVAGWSEAALEGKLPVVRAAIEGLADHLVGQDPRRVEFHWQRLYSEAF